jgi:hypothetical protein
MSNSDIDTIQRCPHDKENPYTMVSTALIRDASLSPECRWLLIYLLSNAPGWKIKVKQVAAHVKGHIGRDRVRDLFNEACDAGYMRKEHVFGNYKYYISETPKFKKCLQSPENQGTDNQGTENQSALSNISCLKNDQKASKPPNPQTGEAPDGACEMLAFGNFMKLKKTDHEKLCKAEGFEVIAGLIDEMNDYLAASGKKPYKDYAAALRLWIARRKKQAKPPQPISDAPKLNPAQQDNWNLNHELVNELKIECPNKAQGLNFFYKHHILKDRNDPSFDVSGLINHRDFCRVLGKHLKLKIEEAKFPNVKV